MRVIAENIERLFLEDTRNKKRIGSNIYSRTGTRGYTGKILFPSDLLSGKDKRQYKKNGVITVSNLYSEIVSFEDFKALPEVDQKRHLQAYRQQHSNDFIKKQWGIHNTAYYNIVKALKLPKATRTDSKTKVNKSVAIASTPAPVKEAKPSLLQLIETPAPIAPVKEKGLSLSLMGTYTPEEIVRKLDKLGLILDGETANFTIELNIKEV